MEYEACDARIAHCPKLYTTLSNHGTSFLTIMDDFGNEYNTEYTTDVMSNNRLFEKIKRRATIKGGLVKLFNSKVDLIMTEEQFINICDEIEKIFNGDDE